MRSLYLTLFFLLPITAHADLSLANLITKSENSSQQESSPIIVRESPHSYDITLSNLKKAINGKNYRLIKTLNFKQGFSKGSNSSNDLIVYFCNFSLVDKAIKTDNRIGQFLPCRITIFERDGKVYLMSMNPQSIGNLLHNSLLKETCNKVTNMYREIMDEATI